MKLVNSKGLMSIERKGPMPLEELRDKGSFAAETVYIITMPSGNNLGFSTSEQYALDNEFRNFVLALNLTQKRVCINYRGGNFQPDEDTLKVPEPKTTLKESDGGFHLESEETLVFREQSFSGSGIWGEIDEKKAADIFQRIQKLGRLDRKDVSQLQTMNLIDALNKYESGISEFDRILKFKHFYNSLEIVTNMAGTDLRGAASDKEVDRISSASESDAKDWREFYNRIKHAQKDSNEITKYYDGVDDYTLANRLLVIRTCLNDLLLSKF
jgi:hypothetical protein